MTEEMRQAHGIPAFSPIVGKNLWSLAARYFEALDEVGTADMFDSSAEHFIARTLIVGLPNGRFLLPTVFLRMLAEENVVVVAWGFAKGRSLRLTPEEGEQVVDHMQRIFIADMPHGRYMNIPQYRHHLDTVIGDACHGIGEAFLGLLPVLRIVFNCETANTAKEDTQLDPQIT